MSTISYEDFIAGSYEFLALSKDFEDGWEARGDAQKDGSFYLVKVQCIEDPLDEATSDNTEARNSELNNEGVNFEEDNLSQHDPSTLSDTCNKGIVTYEYHVTYSLSYSVPVLYFNAFYSSGKLLTLEDVWKRVSLQHSEQISLRKWESLTQQEHPVLGRPFFQLHPCNTSKIMTEVSKNCEDFSPIKGKNYIISWLSMFGPVVGLKIPLHYFK